MHLRLLITTILLTLAFTSCKKWLDIQPQSEVSEEVLFSTAEGFEEALVGVYTKCSGEGLYGKELTAGTPEVLAQNYTLTDTDPYS